MSQPKTYTSARINELISILEDKRENETNIRNEYLNQLAAHLPEEVLRNKQVENNIRKEIYGEVIETIKKHFGRFK
ncbi:hypothetical protein [Paenibacillus elgii]|uniref:hypothetical protein n=1 Tax=Paenibacillus elgii TaxID=189691 RepID=UPI000248D373|nr:hypothetical protein [Paenibacillus elgii]